MPWIWCRLLISLLVFLCWKCFDQCLISIEVITMNVVFVCIVLGHGVINYSTTIPTVLTFQRSFRFCMFCWLLASIPPICRRLWFYTFVFLGILLEFYHTGPYLTPFFATSLQVLAMKLNSLYLCLSYANN